MGNVNSQFIISMLIIALGYAGKRFNIIKEKDGEGLANTVLNFTLPAVVISTFSTMKVDTSLLALPFIGIAYGGFMAVLALYAFRKEARDTRGMLSMMAPGFNIGLFAYPLVEALWGSEGLKHFAMLDMGNAVIVFGISYLLANYFSPDAGSIDLKSMLNRVMRSIPLLTYMITLAVNLSGLHFPGFVVDVSKILSRANMPLSLLLLGIYLSFSLEGSYRAGMVKVLAMRYGIGLAAGILLFFVVPAAPLFRNTLLIGLILPTPMVVIPYSVQFNYNKKFVGTVSNATNIISFLLVWLISAIMSSI